MQLNSTYIVHLTEDTTTKVDMYQSRGEPFYETEFEIWDGFGVVGSTENYCN